MFGGNIGIGAVLHSSRSFFIRSFRNRPPVRVHSSPSEARKQPGEVKSCTAVGQTGQRGKGEKVHQVINSVLCAVLVAGHQGYHQTVHRPGDPRKRAMGVASYTT